MILLVMLGATVIIATPLGRSWVESALDGADLGPAGVLSVERLEGDLWSAVTIHRVAIADADGVWLSIENIALRWRPTALFDRTLAVESVSAERVEILRRPDIGSDDERSDGASSGWRLRLGELSLPQVVLNDGVLGGTATIRIDGSGDLGGGSSSLALNVERQDQPGDSLALNARWSRRAIDGDMRLRAEPGGPMAALAGMPESAISANGEASFSDGRGALNAQATIDGASVLDVVARLDGETWTLDADARPGRVRPLAEISARLGQELSVHGTLAPARERRRALQVSTRSSAVEISVSGDLRARDYRPAAPLAIVIEASDLSRLVGDDVPVSLGFARFEGALTTEPRLRLAGDASIANVNADVVALSEIAGPVSLEANGDVIALQADLAGVTTGEPSAATRLVGERPRLEFDASYDRASGAARVRTASLDLAGAVVEATGERGRGGAVRADATIVVANLGETLPNAEGRAQVSLSVRQSGPETPIEIEIVGDGADVALADRDLNALIGAAPALRLDARIDGGAVLVSRASLTGAGFEFSAAGVVGPEPDDVLTADIALSGVLGAGPVALDGAFAAALEGRSLLGAPAIRLEAGAQSLVVAGEEIRGPNLRAEINLAAGAASGPIQFNAETDHGSISFSTTIGVAEGGLDASDILAEGAGFALTGGVAVDGAGIAEGELSALAPDDRAALRLTLAAVDGAQHLAGEIEFAAATLGGARRLRSARLAFEGGFDALDLTLHAEADLPANAVIDVSGRLARQDAGAWLLTLEPRATVDERSITAPAPWTLAASADRVTVDAGLAVSSGGAAQLSLERDAATRLTISATSMPLDLLASLAGREPLAGTLNASAELSGADWLAGPARIEIDGLRPPGDAIDAEVDAEFVLEFAQSGLTGSASARGGDGFTANAHVEAPVALAAWPPAPVLDDAVALSGDLRAEGPIEEIWAVIGPPNQAASGALSAQAALSGAPASPVLSGRAEITGGRFQDGASGLDLRDLEAVASFADGRARLERFSARDAQGGTLQASGAHVLATGVSEVSIELASLRIADRPDARVVATGEASARRADREISVSAEIDVVEAELAPPDTGPAGVPVLDVEEVNRPDDLAPPPERAAPLNAALDVHVSADRRIFFRTGGLDTEWSFDVRVTGQSSDPVVTGQARLVRGSLELAGERFTFDEAVVRLNGSLDDVRINLVARRERADLVAIVRITGTAAEPRIALESTPSYPEDEILARVLFGRSVSELSALEAAQLANALRGLAGGGGGGLDMLGALRRGLGVDRLGVRTDADAGAVVTGGTYLGDDVYLEVESSAAGGAGAEIQWRLRPRLEIASRLGGGRDTSVSVRWRRDY